MKGYLSGAARRRFCEGYLRTLDPRRAAEGCGRRDGWALLEEPGVQAELERMREVQAGEIRREDAVRRLAELAFGRANDCVRLVLEQDPRLNRLDLSLLSEVKRSEKGAVEVRLIDRLRALEQLAQMAEDDNTDLEAFLKALQGGEEEP